MKCAVTLLTTTLLQIAPLATVFAQDDESEQLTEITVTGKRIANTRPAGSYASIATALRFDPGTELQSRGLPEGQADVTVRGGLFENTGFRAGAITIMDPQTGHYAADLPIDPELLTGPELLIGIENAAVLRRDEKNKLHIKETGDWGGGKGAVAGGAIGAASVAWLLRIR